LTPAPASKAPKAWAADVALVRAMSACEYDRPVGVQFGRAIMLPVCARHGEGPPAVSELRVVVSGLCVVDAQPQIERAASMAAHVRMDMCRGSAWLDNNAMLRAFARDTNEP
jgi:hypothetical protein